MGSTEVSNWQSDQLFLDVTCSFEALDRTCLQYATISNFTEEFWRLRLTIDQTIEALLLKYPDSNQQIMIAIDQF